MSEKIDHKIRFDEANNRVVIPMDYVNLHDNKIYVPTHLLRQVLPLPESDEDKLRWLDQTLHEIRKEKLMNLKTYFLHINRIAKAQEDIRKKAEKVKKRLELDILKIIAKTWLDEKNILKEGRLAHKLLVFEEQNVNLIRAKIEAGLD